MTASNSRGPMWCAPHIEGQHLRDSIAGIVRKGGDWFHEVYELLQKHEIASDERRQFYRHAQSVEDALRTRLL